MIKLDEYEVDKTKHSAKELFREQYIIQKKQSDLIDLHTRLNKQAEYLPDALKDFGANYNRLEQLGTGFKGVGLDIASGTTQLLTSFALGRLIDPLDEFIKLKRDINKESAQYQRDIEISDIKSLNDIGRWGSGAITNMIPSVSMAFTGPAALPLFFVTGFGDKGLEMSVNEADAITRIANNKKILEENTNISDEERLNIENQITQDNKIANLTDLQKLSSQVLYGLAEVVFERLGTIRLLKNLTKSLKGLPAENWKQGVKIFAKETYKAAPVEGFTELATTLAQNTVDIHVLEEDKNYFEGALETFAQGALMGAFFGSASGVRGIIEASLSEVSNKKDKAEINSAIDKIEKLTGKKFHNIDAETDIDIKDPTVRKIVNDLIGGIKQKKASILARLDSGALTLEQVKEIGEANRKIRKLNKDFRQAIQAGKISPDQLTEVKDYYRNKIEELIEQREALFGTSEQQLQNKKSKLKRRIEFENAEGYEMYLNATLRALENKYANNFKSIENKQSYYDQAKNDLVNDSSFNKLSDVEKERQIETKAIENYINEKIKQQILKGEKNTREYIQAAGYSDTIESDKSYDEL